ncbi:MAG: FtsX-like permease family protein [Chloroflexi bacterium]|nr:FtsX-like permease family protein [Chloroflexota bacterium]
MDSLFGVPMNYIMVALLALLAISLTAVGYVALRHTIVFKMGLRNMPRRVAQTVLIVLGLMLSTLIISAAFTTGDTVDYSISDQAYSLLGHVDITVEAKSESSGAGVLPGHGDAGSPVVAASRDVPGDKYQAFTGALDRAKLPDVDGYAGVLYEEVPVVNPATDLSEPSISMTGLDAARLAAFPDVVSATTGRPLDVSTLGPDELYINKSAAGELDAKPGQELQVYINLEPQAFTVVDVVEDRVLTGANSTESRLGLVTRLDTLQGLLGHDRVDFIAVSLNGGVRDTLHLTDGVEDQLKGLIRENGLNLAMGDSKNDAVKLAEQFGNFMTTFFLLMGLFSIGAGMLLIVMIFVMLAAERKSEMGMARAVGMKRDHLVQMFMSEGTAYNILSAMVGALLGILVAFALAYAMAAIFSQFGISITPYVTLRTLVISYSLGVVLTFITVTFASWRVSKLNIVRAIRDIPEPSGRRMGWRGLAFWSSMIVVGALLFVTGMSSNQAFPFALGFSLMGAGAAVVLRFAGLPERPVFTSVGVLLLVVWGFVAGQRLEWLFGPLEGDVEMFFLSGIAMVTASTFVVIYNSDVVLGVLSWAGGFFGSILPALKTAVAYPLSSKFRTGMTLAMISLVVFALTMMSTMNLNFDRLFLTDEARGGWDVQVMENANNPIEDLSSTLHAAGSAAPDEFRAVGRIGLAGGFSATQVRSSPDAKFQDYPVKGVDDAFVDGGDIRLEARARGYESDEAVWQALRTRDDAAIIDDFAVRSGFGPREFSLSGVEIKDSVFDPVPLEVRNPVSGATEKLQIVGIITFASSSNFQGVFVRDSVFREVLGEPKFSLHYVALNDPHDSKRVAKEIESTLVTAGAQADSLKEIADRNQALSRNFLYLMQAFMGLGLFVGIAAVGVIAFRTVVERRQQIGMLRAIGYKRGTVALSFLMESSFVTLLGILSGIGLGLWLSYFLVTSDEFPGSGSGYFVPWLQIAFIAVFTYAASLLMTWIPSRQAATIPTAEALRYE